MKAAYAAVASLVLLGAAIYVMASDRLTRPVEPGTSSAPFVRAAPASSRPPPELPPAESRVQELAPPAPAVIETVASPAAAAPSLAKAQLRGRVLQPDGRTPAAGARVELELQPRRPFDQLSHLADADGRFAFDLDDRALEGAEFKAIDEASHAWFLRDDFASDLSGGLDLGDIVLDVWRGLRFRAIDDGQRPLAKARAFAEGVDGLDSRATGDDGLGLIEPLPRGCQAIEVWAPGHSPTRVDLPDPLPVEPLTVILEPCAALAIRVIPPDGKLPDGLVVHVKAAKSPFARAHPAPDGSVDELDPRAVRLGMTEPMIMFHPARADGTHGEDVVALFGVESRGGVLLDDVRPDVELIISVHEPSGGVAWGPQSVTLQPREVRTLDVALPRSGHRVEVRVRDATGQPVASAQVGLKGPDAFTGASQLTGQDGLAAFEGVLAERATISVERDPWARAVLPDVPLTGVDPVDVTLGEGVGLSVDIVDAAGQPLEVDVIFVGLAGYVFPEYSSEAGWHRHSHFALTGLPAGPVELIISRGRQSQREQVDARVGATTITVPWTADEP